MPEDSRKKENAACPGCGRQGLSGPGAFCSHCGRYREKPAEISSLQNPAPFGKTGRGYQLVLPWMRNRKHKMMLYALHFTWAVLGVYSFLLGIWKTGE